VFLSTPTADYNNLPFAYEVISESTIAIRGRLSAEWDLELGTADLVVHSEGWPTFGGAVRLVRASSPPWPAFAMAAAALIGCAFLVPMRHGGMAGPSGGGSPSVAGDTRSGAEMRMARVLLSAAAAVGCVFTGVAGGILAASMMGTLRVTLPWDGILMLEAGVAAIVLGTRSVRRFGGRIRTRAIGTLGGMCLGLVALGAGMSFSGVGTLRLVLLAYGY
jgi:hypothetical protein